MEKHNYNSVVMAALEAGEEFDGSPFNEVILRRIVDRAVEMYSGPVPLPTVRKFVAMVITDRMIMATIRDEGPPSPERNAELATVMETIVRYI
jgi:hypothetical protein